MWRVCEPSERLRLTAAYWDCHSSKYFDEVRVLRWTEPMHLWMSEPREFRTTSFRLPRKPLDVVSYLLSYIIRKIRATHMPELPSCNELPCYLRVLRQAWENRSGWRKDDGRYVHRIDKSVCHQTCEGEVAKELWVKDGETQAMGELNIESRTGR